MATICTKCGASISDDAGFCPSCGAPKKVVPQASQPMQPMAFKTGNASPFEGIFNVVFSKTAILIGICIGILFVWIGVIINTFATGSVNIATMVSSMGFGAMGLMLVSGGIWNKKIDKFTRLGMVGIGAYTIVQTMSISSSITSIFSGLS
jgi:hypothetical protein